MKPEQKTVTVWAHTFMIPGAKKALWMMCDTKRDAIKWRRENRAYKRLVSKIVKIQLPMPRGGK